MVSSKLLALLAQSVHQANKIFSEQVLSEEKKDWALLDKDARNSLVNAVRKTLELKVEDPEQSHEMWLTEMVKSGWKYGEEYSETEKTHPCMVHYADLPQGQQTKDEIYLAILKPFYTLV